MKTCDLSTLSLTSIPIGYRLSATTYPYRLSLSATTYPYRLPVSVHGYCYGLPVSGQVATAYPSAFSVQRSAVYSVYPSAFSGSAGQGLTRQRSGRAVKGQGEPSASRAVEVSEA
jgi:hypothetical protein